MSDSTTVESASVYSEPYKLIWGSPGDIVSLSSC